MYPIARAITKAAMTPPRIQLRSRSMSVFVAPYFSIESSRVSMRARRSPVGEPFPPPARPGGVSSGITFPFASVRRS